MKFACKNFHYSKSMPCTPFGYNVYENNEWCGCIIYGRGANFNIAKPFDMVQGQVIELTRMAMNGKQSCTSKALSLSLKLVKKSCPIAKLVVSYADTEQGHIGTIYQATNWIYLGDTGISHVYIDPADGKPKHKKSLYEKYGNLSTFEKHSLPTKHKYVYCLDRDVKKKIEKMKKPYPRK